MPRHERAAEIALASKRSWSRPFTGARPPLRNAEDQAARIAFGLLSQLAHRAGQRVQLKEESLQLGQCLGPDLLHAAAGGIDSVASALTGPTDIVGHSCECIGTPGNAVDGGSELVAGTRGVLCRARRVDDAGAG